MSTTPSLNRDHKGDPACDAVGLIGGHSGIALVAMPHDCALWSDAELPRLEATPTPVARDEDVLAACTGPIEGVPDRSSLAAEEGIAESEGGGAGLPSAALRRGMSSALTRGTGNMTVTTHEELALRARDGDAQALQLLLELIDSDGSIRVPVRRLIMDADAVEDVSQEVLIRVAERIGSWEGRSLFTTWLGAVARNMAIDHLRRLRPSEELPEEVVSGQQRLSSMIATNQLVRDVVAALPETYRQPVVLRDIEQLDYGEIARLLDLPAAIVRLRVSRGRAMVAAAWHRSVS